MNVYKVCITLLISCFVCLPENQFGFRKQRSTIEQIHRITHNINQSLEKKKYCSAIFLDIQQHSTKYGMKGFYTNLKKSYHTPTTPS